MLRKHSMRGSAGLLEEVAESEVVFARTASIAESIQDQVYAAAFSLDAALYRFTLPPLARALKGAQERGLRLRLLIDHNKYRECPLTRRLLADGGFSFRLASGRDGARGKMHHKFVVLDDKVVLTGSYNWTLASEKSNHENLLVLRQTSLVESYLAEFDALWSDAEAPET
jgi:mitochondrial cardiolipin hydrolase